MSSARTSHLAIKLSGRASRNSRAALQNAPGETLHQRPSVVFHPVDSGILRQSPRRSLVPLAHGIGGPLRTFIGMARSAGVRDFVFVRHRRSNKSESVRVNHRLDRAFGFNCRHVAGHALASGTSLFVMSMFFDRRGAWTVWRLGAMTIEAQLIGWLA